jgi:hypothetical protein
MYQHKDELKLIEFIPNETKEKTFGNGRYSLRNRIPKLNHFFGEKIVYKRDSNGETLSSIFSSRQSMRSLWDNFINVKKNKKKKLVKGLKKNNFSEDNEKIKNNNNNIKNIDISNFDEELPDNWSERGEDNEDKIIIIKSLSQKPPCKNYSTPLQLQIIEGEKLNKIHINDKEYKNVGPGKILNIDSYAIYDICNYSNKDLIVQIVIPSNSD